MNQWRPIKETDVTPLGDDDDGSLEWGWQRERNGYIKSMTGWDFYYRGGPTHFRPRATHLNNAE